MATRTLEQQRALRALTAKGSQRLELAWRQSLDKDPLKTKAALLDLVPPLGSQFDLAAGTLAADWYDDYRERVGARGRFEAEPASPATFRRYLALIGWAIDPLFGEEPDEEAALSKLDGGFQSILTAAFVNTITKSSIDDPVARGWARDGRGECDFCQMLIGRGAVYTEATADFESHDRCHCVAVPVFD